MNRLFSVVSFTALAITATYAQPVLAQTREITQVQVEATADGGLAITLGAGEFQLSS
ncbi:MAG: hypothetical protein GVY17_12610, partial [Cyanobacteria bacterium]|nr:hypothetical protein [Cyanobacteria bacterium GSL.Bin21]